VTTSNFARNSNNPKAIAISRGIPNFYRGLSFPKLAPTWAMLDMTDEDYDERFSHILEELDAKEVYEQLKDAVLLCWESPNVKCHRRMVAEWFERELGVVVTEEGFERSDVLPYAVMPHKGEKPGPKTSGGRQGMLLF